MPTFAPNTSHVDDRGFGASRQGAAVTGAWVHHQADGGGADAIEYMAGDNSRDSHPTYAVDDDIAASVVGIVHPNKAPSSTFYVNDQYAIAFEVANIKGEPNWEVQPNAIEQVARVVAHHALESPRAAHPIEVNVPGATQKGFWVGWHSQVFATACPGPYLTARIPEIVARANQIKDAVQRGASWNEATNNAEGFLMALNDAQQQDLYNKVNAVFDANVAQPGPGKMYYKIDAAIDVIRKEANEIKSGAIKFPGADYLAFHAVINELRSQKGAAPIAIDEKKLAEAISAAILPTLEKSVSGADAKAVADELAKRLAA